jgi:hypothetical protein
LHDLPAFFYPDVMVVCDQTDAQQIYKERPQNRATESVALSKN